MGVRGESLVAGVLVLLCAADAGAQTQRLAVLLAQERRTASAADLATLRAGMRSADTDAALLAIRALGRMERPALVPDIASALRFQLPELRSEAAYAIAASFGRPAVSPPAAHTAPGGVPPAGLRTAVASALGTLRARLDVEAVPDVRSAICESIGRLPYVDADQASQAEEVLVGAARLSLAEGTADRLGAAKGLDAFVRISADRKPLGSAAVDALRALLRAPGTEAAPRVRRLAADALLSVHLMDADSLERAAADPEMQVRLLAMDAAGRSDIDLPPDLTAQVLAAGLIDQSPIVRLEAVHAEAAREPGSAAACRVAMNATGDADVHVALAAIDALGSCAASNQAVEWLAGVADDLSALASARGWHRAAHALVALAQTSPDRAKPLVPRFAASIAWPARLYAVKAAAVLNDVEVLRKMTADADDAVAGEAQHQLARIGGDANPRPVGGSASPSSAVGAKSSTVLNAADLKRLAAARARITIRDAGTFELALLTLEAPETVLRFARLAASGYYDGLPIERVLPNFVVQTKAPGSHAAAEPPVDPRFPHDELSAWPHVRGALALSSDGHQPGDAQLFLDLVDNPGFDYQYTVFAQAVSGFDVMDGLLEGDVIETIEILSH